MENRLKVPLKYKFPAFRVLHWYACFVYLNNLEGGGVSFKQLITSFYETFRPQLLI